MARRVMKAGKTFKNCNISGLLRSGETQILINSSSISIDPYDAKGRGLKMSSMSGGGVIGLGGSSMVSEWEAERGTALDRGEDE